MKQEITKTNGNAEHRFGLSNILERVVVAGDLSRLSPEERLDYYRRVCESLGLNPLTRPFDYIVLNGKLTLYARRDATDQLRRIHGISVRIVAREMVEPLGLYVVTARATAPDGREDESIGVVSVKGFSGDALANALMKAETKAKRRATLSLVGLGWTDESEVESVPGATAIRVDHETGEILEGSPETPDIPHESVSEADGPSNMQLKLLKILLKKTGMEDRDLALGYSSLVVGRTLTTSKELSRREISNLIDHLKSLESWMDGLELSQGMRHRVMAEAVANNEVISNPEMLLAVVGAVS
jgi:hypothetical protein